MSASTRASVRLRNKSTNKHVGMVDDAKDAEMTKSSKYAATVEFVNNLIRKCWFFLPEYVNKQLFVKIKREQLWGIMNEAIEDDQKDRKQRCERRHEEDEEDDDVSMDLAGWMFELVSDTIELGHGDGPGSHYDTWVKIPKNVCDELSADTDELDYMAAFENANEI